MASAAYPILRRTMNLESEIFNYQNRSLSDLQAIRAYYESLSFERAIRGAATGMESNLKINSHQYRIGRKKGKVASEELFKYIDEIKHCESFEGIFEITERVRRSILGLGDLWSYDTALRIGFNLGFRPSRVYVQRGVVKGVRKLLEGYLPKGRSLPLSVFPDVLHQFEPYVVENFLCIYGKDGKNSFC